MKFFQIKYPQWFPYPIAWARAFGYLTILVWGLRLIAVFDIPPILFTHPLILIVLWSSPIWVVMIFHLILSKIFHLLKGIDQVNPLQSLWEGLMTWLAVVFGVPASFALTVMLFVDLYYEDWDLYYDDWGMWRSPFDELEADTEAMVFFSVVYLIIAAYIHHVEYLIHKQQQAKTKLLPPKKESKLSIEEQKIQIQAEMVRLQQKIEALKQQQRGK